MAPAHPLPALRLTWPGGSRDFTTPVVSIGRVAGVDLVLDHPDISRRHAEFRRTSQGWYLVDLQSTNGTARDDRRIVHDLIGPGTTARIVFGGVNGVRVLAEVQPLPLRQAQRPVPPQHHVASPPWTPAPAVLPGRYADGHTVLPGNQPLNRSVTIGRSSTCDVVIDDALVSRQHATIVLGPRPVLRDLNSFNGTYVSGRRLQGR